MPHWCGCFAERNERWYITVALKVVYNSNKNYDELLRDNNEFSIHQRHLRALLCEVFKSLNNLNPEFIWSYFVFKT